MALTFDTSRRPVSTDRPAVVVSLIPGYDFTTGLPSVDPVEVERAPDSGGAPGTPVSIARLGPLPARGIPFIDPRPLDGATWWYRYRHFTNDGAEFGDWTDWQSAIADVLPIDSERLFENPVYPIARDAPFLDGDTAARGLRRRTHGQNVLHNIGFEDGTPFWNFTTGSSVVTNATNAHTGNKYGQIVGSAGSERNIFAADDAGATAFIEVNPGDVVQLSGWGYREMGDQVCDLVVDERDKDLGGGVQTTSADFTTASWAQVSLEVTVGAGKKYVAVYVSVRGGTVSSTLRVDDLALKILRPADDVLPGNLRSGVKDSTGIELRRTFKKASHTDPDDLNSVPDGSTYARILGTKLSSGAILRSATFSDGKTALKAADAAGKETDDDLFILQTKTLKIGTVASPSTIAKTIRFHHAELVPLTNSTTWIYADVFVVPGTANVNAQFQCPVVIPKGVTITKIRARMYKENSGDTATATLKSVASDTATSQDTVTLTATQTWTTVEGSTLSLLVGSESYTIFVSLTGVSANNHARFQFFEIDYTIPSYDKGY